VPNLARFRDIFFHRLYLNEILSYLGDDFVHLFFGELLTHGRHEMSKFLCGYKSIAVLVENSENEIFVFEKI
jgi:hypothetical protein